MSNWSNGSDTLAMVGHDLRSTLNALGMTMDLLTEGHLGTLNEKGLKLVSSSSAAVRQLINMTHELIDAGDDGIGQAAINYRLTPAGAMIEKAVNMLESRLAGKSMQLTVDLTPGLVKVDADRMVRVFLNLLDNAIKFSPFGSSICITSRMTADFLEVRVVDEGPGVASDKAASIFEKFARGDAGDVPGYGLGLAFCKSVVEAHGGAVGVETCAGGGSCFWVKIPREASPSIT